ncbi:hypothetical protein PVAP13_4KG096033 [Panicum virgatum]|uniref:Uncharacterized protein n=1 Tax=Panicum virgatum TaxID=38727 RepID=A0A8T0TMN9_PANVG|nr:hypothetical protein PVAP13_4KG096033 [Panicum virgatum]
MFTGWDRRAYKSQKASLLSSSFVGVRAGHHSPRPGRRRRPHACRPAQSTSAAAISAGSSRASGRPPSAAASRPAHPPGRSQTMITRSFALLFEGLPAGAARLAPCGRRRAAPPRRRQPRR